MLESKNTPNIFNVFIYLFHVMYSFCASILFSVYVSLYKFNIDSYDIRTVRFRLVCYTYAYIVYIYVHLCTLYLSINI